ncbi:VanZ family protein, partial [bacterium]|nr:VanZ family protein [bacterium]
MNYFRWAAILWMAVIFLASADSGSGEHSLLIVELVCEFCQFFGLNSPSEDTLLLLHMLLRKGAHMGEFALLYWLWHKSGLGKTQAFAVAVLYACSDEWHQTFVENRVGCVDDV